MTHLPTPPHGWAPAVHAAPTSRPAACPATPIEPGPDIAEALEQLRRTFPGLCIWHGQRTGSYWALLPNRLVEAKTSIDLARQLHTAGLMLPRRPGPHTRNADGTWNGPTPSAPRPGR
ncbi:hypothetical protein E1200_29875, partial [Actinomadura sp. GC306]